MSRRPTSPAEHCSKQGHASTRTTGKCKEFEGGGGNGDGTVGKRVVWHLGKSGKGRTGVQRWGQRTGEGRARNISL